VAKNKVSPEWAPQAVVDRLRARTAGGRPASVQVFMNEDVRPEDLPAKAEEIVTAAGASLGLGPGSVRVGRIHKLAKSFSVTSDQPQVFEAIANRSDVKAIVESEQSDILPKPV
jgi:hypothetical protein